MFWIFACTSNPKNFDTAVDTAQNADTAELIEEIDADGDGYPVWNSTLDWERADCDDSDPSVNPLTERLIPEGPFIRGFNGPMSGPEREITLSAYCMDVYETTNQEFMTFMQDAFDNGLNNETASGLPLFDFEDDDDVFPERILRASGGFAVMAGYENHPVVEVWKWSGEAYCASKGKTLPTEAQWEKGARGEDGRRYPWGNDDASCELSNFGTMNQQCVGDTIDVGSYPLGVSPYGLHDMAGNVAEFVSDWFQAQYYAESEDVDPQGPDYGYFSDGQGNSFVAIVARSGNHATTAGDIQTFYRQPEPEEATSNGVGFRCARQVYLE